MTIINQRDIVRAEGENSANTDSDTPGIDQNFSARQFDAKPALDSHDVIPTERAVLSLGHERKREPPFPERERHALAVSAAHDDPPASIDLRPAAH